MKGIDSSNQCVILQTQILSGEGAVLTIFSLLGAIIYIGVACLAAWAGAVSKPSDRRLWLSIALLFLGLAAWRIGNGEELFQHWARNYSHVHGYYQQRREWQGPIAVIAILAAAGLLLGFFASQPSSALQTARRFTLLLLGYTILRMLSFHPVDAVIYSGIGPLKINYLIDIGLSVACGLCAFDAASSVRRRRGLEVE